MWGTVFIIVGVLLGMLTMIVTEGHRGMRGMKHDMMNFDEYDEYGDGMDMSMNDMSDMLEGKTGDDFDAAFLEGMIPHHQGAIDMANTALKNAGHQEIKDMAKAIIAAQQKEITQMQQWADAWGFTDEEDQK